MRVYSPHYSMLCMFGYTCYVVLPSTEGTKLTASSARCVLLGISSEQKGYCCYNFLAHCLCISHYVSFAEDCSYFSPPPQDVHFLSPLDTLSVESSRVSIDPTPLAPIMSIQPTILVRSSLLCQTLL